MPLYECRDCGKTSEFLQKMSEGQKRKCPECGALRLKRKIGTDIQARFKGTGFYETDYKRKDDVQD